MASINEIIKAIQDANKPLSSFGSGKDSTNKNLVITQPSNSNTSSAIAAAVGSKSLGQIKMPVKYKINGKDVDVYYNNLNNQLIYYSKDKNKYYSMSDKQSADFILSNRDGLNEIYNKYKNDNTPTGTVVRLMYDNVFKKLNTYLEQNPGVSKEIGQQIANKVSPTSGGTGSAGGGGGYNNAAISDLMQYYNKKIEEQQKEIDELKNPKVWTAEELAKQFNVEDMYNMDYFNNLYNTKTNKYYTDKIAEQQKINDDNNQSNAAYAARLLNKYVDSYRNAAPTAMGRGTLAANALIQNLGAAAINEEAATNLNNLVNDYKENWNAELANNPNLARTAYNNLGTWLIGRGVATNTAEVQNYINELKALDTAYSGTRNAQVNLTKSAADAYNYNAQAALAKNQQAAGNAENDFLRSAYKIYYGEDNNLWQKAYNNTNHDRAVTYYSNYN